MQVKVPEIHEKEKVDLPPSSTALLIVDMQNDFVHKDGKLYVPDAEKTVEPIRDLIKKFRNSGSLVIYTQDWHMKDDPEFKIWGEHALAGTWGAEIYSDLSPDKDDFLIRKYRYDAFFGTSLDYLLRVKNIKNIVVTGTVANICVLHTAGSAALRWYNVIVPKEGISALDEFDYFSTLRQVDFLYKGIITTFKGVNLQD
ncbi:cysteine hydrolase family protein [Sulfuracidifex tepidarius]|uniref:Peroxyureidoacrylate/ureidoacrylate amidohydrolase RutB n=1 Tax=Sulfuracidifex tepidarius TaxID=1294262 RepID=A0A510DRR8_9CREN|nr:isochorismatase family cysteine hydrolase [Sulfuracidifex tepidarius]BBG22877.1 Peroxyureidoacrylate/ureidoacrylate amidohydrolase RutB [Sulfuracidifex tepidarius]BBG25638.1 Peroxyureidoacrylate/ureidoacrylate amidohydrolase RutB [Sulfuracidifex tepidarius]